MSKFLLNALGVSKYFVSSAAEEEDHDDSVVDASTTEAYATRIRRPALQALHRNLSETEQYDEAAELRSKMQRQLSKQQYSALIQYLQEYVDNYRKHGANNR